MLKKIVTIVMALAMCFAFPISALANGTSNANITTTVTSAGGRTLAITNDGALWGWGTHTTPHKELPDPRYPWLEGGVDTGFQNKPVKIIEGALSVACDDCYAAVIKNDHSLWMWGLYDEVTLLCGETFSPIKVMEDVAAISFGSRHAAVIKTDSSLWLWGENGCGQIGNNREGNATREDDFGRIHLVQTVPVKIMDDVVSVSCGGDFTAAIKKDGTLWTWGCNGVGSLGNGEKGSGGATVDGNAVTIHEDHSKDKYVPQKIMDDVVSVSCAYSIAAAIKRDGTLWTWGSYLGEPKEVMDNVVQAYCGGYYIGALKADGSVWISGWDGSGIFHDLSLGSDTDWVKAMDDCVVISVSGSDSIDAVYGLKRDGSLCGMGVNQWLGIGKGSRNSLDYGITTTPVKILSKVAFPSGMLPIVVPDVPSSWAKAEVESAISLGIVPEDLQKNYKKSVSRENVAEMFIYLIEESRAESIDEILTEEGAEINKNAFSDTSDENVLAANALGIINGIGNGKFNPNGTLTRAQVAAIINRVAKVVGIDTEGYTHNFTDVSNHWVNSELGWPSSEGIITGVGNNKFNPNWELTTEQTILITYRALQVLAEE